MESGQFRQPNSIWGNLVQCFPLATLLRKTEFPGLKKKGRWGNIFIPCSQWKANQSSSALSLGPATPQRTPKAQGPEPQATPREAAERETRTRTRNSRRGYLQPRPCSIVRRNLCRSETCQRGLVIWFSQKPHEVGATGIPILQIRNRMRMMKWQAEYQTTEKVAGIWTQVPWAP